MRHVQYMSFIIEFALKFMGGFKLDTLAVKPHPFHDTDLFKKPQSKNIIQKLFLQTIKTLKQQNHSSTSYLSTH